MKSDKRTEQETQLRKAFRPTQDDLLRNVKREQSQERKRHGRVEGELIAVINSLQAHNRTLNGQLVEMQTAILEMLAVNMKPTHKENQQ